MIGCLLLVCMDGYARGREKGAERGIGIKITLTASSGVLSADPTQTILGAPRGCSWAGLQKCSCRVVCVDPVSSMCCFMRSACHVLLEAGLGLGLGKNPREYYQPQTIDRTCMLVCLHTPSRTQLTSEVVTGNEAFLPVNPMAQPPVWASSPSKPSFHWQRRALESPSIACLYFLSQTIASLSTAGHMLSNPCPTCRSEISTISINF